MIAKFGWLATLSMIVLTVPPVLAAARTPAQGPSSGPTRTPGLDSRHSPSAAWIATPAVQARLASGGVAVHSVVDKRRSRGSVEAAIRIHASARAIWPLITKCKYAAWLIPGLRRCRTLKTAPDGSWADIEHDIKYSLFLPMLHSVFRADFHPPYRMDFHRIAGNLKYEVGSWRLLPSAAGTTTVEYRVSLQPGFWVPHFMIRRTLRKRLPGALKSLRRHAEHLAAASAASPAPRA